MVKKREWSVEEIKILKKEYPLKGTECCSLFIGRSKSSIDYKVFEEYFKDFIIGFIDGDGHIRFDNKSKVCTVEIHKSWFNMLISFSNYLKNKCNITSHVKYTKNGKYVRLTIQNKKNMMLLNELRGDLPVLERKWSKIKL